MPLEHFSLSLTHCVPRVDEAVRAFFGRELFQDGADIFPQIVPASRLVLPQEALELGERLLDRIGIGAAGRKERKMGARAPDRGAHRFGLVAARSVHDDDVASIGRRDQLRFDIGPEGVAVGRTVQNPGSVDPVLPQSGHECEGSPMAEGAPAVPGRHVGLHAGLVDEDQLARIRPALKALPPLAAALHVGPVALVRDGRRLLAGEAADSQEAPNRGETRRDASPAKPIPQPRKRDRRTGLDPPKDPSPMPRKLRCAARAHPARTGRSRVGISPSPFDHARRGRPQLLRNAPAAVARQHLLDRAHPQIVRIRSRHPFLTSTFFSAKHLFLRVSA